MSKTRGSTAKFLSSTTAKKGRWSQKEVDNLRMSIELCGKEATPKELSFYIPTRDHTQIRKYIDKLKISGEFDLLFPDTNDIDDETFGGNHINFEKDYGPRKL